MKSIFCLAAKERAFSSPALVWLLSGGQPNFLGKKLLPAFSFFHPKINRHICLTINFLTPSLSYIPSKKRIFDFFKQGIKSVCQTSQAATTLTVAPRRERAGLSRITISTSWSRAFKKRNNLSVEKPSRCPRRRWDILG